MNVTREPRFGVFLCPKIIYKVMIKVFEEFEYSFADAMRMDSILEFLDDIKDDPDDIDPEPDEYYLLDPHDGYEKQTYIQNLGNGVFKFWEGWSKYCWRAIYHQKQYKGRSKEKVLDMFLSQRFPIIAKECNCTILDSGYYWGELYDDEIKDDYITYVKMKINN